MSAVTISESDEALLWWVAHATANLTGDEFFRTLVGHLASALGLNEVFVAECVDRPTTRMRTLAFWGPKGLCDNFEFDLRGTPCRETVCEKRVCWLPEGVGERYPAEAKYGREGYYGVPIFDAGGENVIGHIAFFDSRRLDRDVFANPLLHIFTARAAAELQRRHAQERANEHLHQLAHLSRVGAMAEMASVIAHEINQPLASILTNSETCLRLLEASPGTPPELLEAMRSVADEAERAGAVIRHLRAFVRKGPLQAEDSDVNALVREAVALARIEARREKIRLEVELEPELPCAHVDRVQVEQVVLNLIRNSVEALRSRPDGQREIHVRTLLARDDAIEICVRDTGPGVEPHLRDRIFEPFLSTKPNGMGMGLAICRSIVESHGGRLTLHDGERNGATFCFTMPVAGTRRP